MSTTSTSATPTRPLCARGSTPSTTSDTYPPGLPRGPYEGAQEATGHGRKLGHQFTGVVQPTRARAPPCGPARVYACTHARARARGTLSRARVYACAGLRVARMQRAPAACGGWAAGVVWAACRTGRGGLPARLWRHWQRQASTGADERYLSRLGLPACRAFAILAQSIRYSIPFGTLHT